MVVMMTSAGRLVIFSRSWPMVSGLVRVGKQAILERVADLLLKVFPVHDDVNRRVAELGMAAELVGREQHRKALA